MLRTRTHILKRYTYLEVRIASHDLPYTISQNTDTRERISGFQEELALMAEHTHRLFPEVDTAKEFSAFVQKIRTEEQSLEHA